MMNLETGQAREKILMQSQPMRHPSWASSASAWNTERRDDAPVDGSSGGALLVEFDALAAAFVATQVDAEVSASLHII